MAHDWDAPTYDRMAGPHERWAGPVLDRLALRGDETVLDAGCGSGRVTRLLLERLPRGRVIGVDQSPAMLATAAEQLADATPRLTLIEAELTALRLPEPVDAVFSNAVFHWLPDHDALFRSLAGVLRGGGLLSAQCGGAGNIDAVRRVADAAIVAVGGRAPAQPYHFATVEATRARLSAAGFSEAEVWPEPQPVSFPDDDTFTLYLRTVVLGPYLAALPAERHAPFLDRTAAALTGTVGRVVDYVRLNIVARRSGPPGERGLLH